MMTAQPQRQRRASTQLDLFRAPRRKPSFTPEKLAQVSCAIWHASKPVAGTLGEAVFRDLRLITPGPDLCRFHSALKRGDDRGPGLVFLLRLRGEPVGVAGLYLDSDGRVFERRILGRAVGATVMPSPP
jgi:hypothetical protein